ncbi:hypothetical protein G6F32_014405 [Rhizopus arrhizus]|nr:hypothetical protein G6F32_014405 [Rhizopus arrhizus]
MAATAPSAAPWLTPTMPGSARGLPNRPCRLAPAIANDAPTIAPSSARGMRSCQTTARSRLLTACGSSRPSFTPSACSTSSGGNRNGPTANDASTAPSSASNATINIIRPRRRRRSAGLMPSATPPGPWPAPAHRHRNRRWCTSAARPASPRPDWPARPGSASASDRTSTGLRPRRTAAGHARSPGSPPVLPRPRPRCSAASSSSPPLRYRC